MKRLILLLENVYMNIELILAQVSAVSKKHDLIYQKTGGYFILPIIEILLYCLMDFLKRQIKRQS